MISYTPIIINCVCLTVSGGEAALETENLPSSVDPTKPQGLRYSFYISMSFLCDYIIYYAYCIDDVV